MGAPVGEFFGTPVSGYYCVKYVICDDGWTLDPTGECTLICSDNEI